MSRNGHVPKRLCPEMVMSRSGHVPKRSCPEVTDIPSPNPSPQINVTDSDTVTGRDRPGEWILQIIRRRRRRRRLHGTPTKYKTTFVYFPKKPKGIAWAMAHSVTVSLSLAKTTAQVQHILKRTGSENPTFPSQWNQLELLDCMGKARQQCITFCKFVRPVLPRISVTLQMAASATIWQQDTDLGQR